jgi:hypothetical protein
LNVLNIQTISTLHCTHEICLFGLDTIYKESPNQTVQLTPKTVDGADTARL